MPSVYELVVAAGRVGLGSQGAASASAGALGLAQRVREWSAALAQQVLGQADAVGQASGQALAAGQVQWDSVAGRAFQGALEAEGGAARALQGELEAGAQEVRLAGEAVAAELELVASAIGAAGAAFDAALAGMAVLDDIDFDDFIVHAERANLPALHGALTSAMGNPLLARVSATLAGEGW
ncbi:hypothetical protein [Rothia nasimurium]|uniref:hypothetical protein n=1 Tax=Rothia nasimurium TaxID=85336 RepID=UPI001F2C09AF|nr:hypothetical protein [Rothia nasimurium]